MRSTYIFTAVIVWIGISVASAQHGVAQTTTKATKPSSDKWLSDLKRRAPQRQEQFAAYWTAEPGWHTEVQLRNNRANQPLSVIPVVRTANGDEYSLPAIVLEPNEVKSLDLGDLLASNAPQLVGAYGSLVFKYNSPFLRNLYAVAMVHDAGYPVEFHLDGESQDNKWKAGSREGIWWFPNSTSIGYLIVTNFSDHPVRTDVSLSDASGKMVSQTVQLGSRSVQRLGLRELVRHAGFEGTFGGIQISTKEAAGSLDSVNIVFDETAGFGAVLKMFDHDPQTQLEHRDFAKSGNGSHVHLCSPSKLPILSWGFRMGPV
jgi:hypothetical protein